MKGNRGARGRPLPFVERLLRRFADPLLVEAAWGDLLEEADAIAARRGSMATRLWLWLEGWRLLNEFARRRVWEATMDTWSPRRRRLTTLLGALALLPAAMLVIGGLLQTQSGSPVIQRALEATLFDPDGFLYRVVLHPATVLGGLGMTIGLNLLPLLRVRFERGHQTFSGIVALRLRPGPLAVGLIGVGLATTVLVYAFGENFEIVARAGAPAPAAAAVGAGWTAVRPAGGDWVVRYTADPLPVTVLRLGATPCRRFEHFALAGEAGPPEVVEPLRAASASERRPALNLELSASCEWYLLAD